MPRQQNGFTTYLTIVWHPTHKVSSSIKFLWNRAHITFGIRARWQAIWTLLVSYSFATRIPLQAENPGYTKVSIAVLSLNTLLVTMTYPHSQIEILESWVVFTAYNSLIRVETYHRCCRSSLHLRFLDAFQRSYRITPQDFRESQGLSTGMLLCSEYSLICHS